jgi:L-ascorbate metabolism protein UlaG (beta-lactamase superfamily)
VRIQDGGGALVTDPVLRSRVAFLRSTGVDLPATSRLPPVVALVSHLHRDHCDLPSLRGLGRELTLVVPGGTAAFFARHGFRRVIPLDAGESCQVAGFTVTATAAEHDGRRWPFGAQRRATGFTVEMAGRRVYFAGDTDVFEGMAQLDRPDLALLPVWGWGRSIGPGHLDPARAADAVELIQPGFVVPIHWGTLRPVWHGRPSLSSPSSPAAQFADNVRDRQLSTCVQVLMPGESLELPA